MQKKIKTNLSFIAAKTASKKFCARLEIFFQQKWLKLFLLGEQEISML